MRKVAFLFPGQGAQYPGMGKDFFDLFSIAKETFLEADDLLNDSISRVIFEGSEAALTETRYSQVAIFVLSMALLRTVESQLPELASAVCAGLSLGEYSALVAAGRISFPDALRLVSIRGKLLQQACQETQGTMSAVLGLSPLEINEIIDSLNPPHRVWVANYNCPGQTVISGTLGGVEAATLALKARGAKRVIPLQVYGAFHSPLMQSAQDRFASAVESVSIESEGRDLVMNVPGDFVSDINEIRANMISQVTHSVCWEQGIEAMKQAHVTHYIEIGCGKTLTGMNKKMGLQEHSFSLEKVQDLDILAHVLSNIGVR